MSQSETPVPNEVAKQLLFLTSVITVSQVPFPNENPDDLIIKLKGRNNEGLIIDACRNDNGHMPLAEAGLCQWLISQMGYMNIEPETNQVFYVRINGVNYER